MKVNTRDKQSGAVLAVSLIILLIVTILSLQGIQTTLMQEKMTSAVRDSHIALEAAESGLVDAQEFIEKLVSTADFVSDGTDGLYSNGDGPTDYSDSASWANVVPASKAPAEAVDGVTPQFFIEELGVIDEEEDNPNLESGYGESSGSGDVTGFRIVSRATGKDVNTVRIVISYYGKRL